MSCRSFVLALTLVAASLAACTDAAPPSAPAATDTVAREWECVSVCFPGAPCHNLCRLSPFDPGFQVVPPPFSCDQLRPINVCGDRCCDQAEARFGQPEYCRKDCRLESLQVVDWSGKASLQIYDGDAVLGTVEPDYISVAPVCK